jgi:hypothetical protein
VVVTNQQLYLMIGIPALAHAAMLGLLMVYLRFKFQAIDQRFDEVHRNFDRMARPKET